MPHVCAYDFPRRGWGATQHDEEKKRMASTNKHAARSQRSHRDNKNFRQFIWNANQRAEAKAQKKLIEMIAEQLRKGSDKNAEED